MHIKQQKKAALEMIHTPQSVGSKLAIFRPSEQAQGGGRCCASARFTVSCVGGGPETGLELWYSSWGVWKHPPQLCWRVIIPGNSRPGTMYPDYIPLRLFPLLVSPPGLLHRAFHILKIDHRTSPSRRTSPATSLITLLCDTLWQGTSFLHFPRPNYINGTGS